MIALTLIESVQHMPIQSRSWSSKRKLDTSTAIGTASVDSV